MTNGSSPTPEQNAQSIADLTTAVAATNAAVNGLVSQFIRPNAQQANANRETLDEVVALLKRHAEVIAGLDIKIDQTATLVQENAKAIQQITTTQAEHDEWLKEIRILQAEANSKLAQLTVKQERNAEAVAQIDAKLDKATELAAKNAEGIESLSTEVQAVAEATRTQLAGIIGNARRIERLEQQAS